MRPRARAAVPDPQRVVPHRAARVARDAPRHHVGEAGQARGDLEELRLAAQRGRDQLHHVAEAAAPECVREGIQPPSSLRTSRVPSTIARELGERDVPRQVDQPAVRVDGEPRRRHDAQGRPDPLGHDGRGLDVVALHVDDAEAERERGVELLVEPDVLVAAPRELQRELLDAGLEDGREQVPVAALPRRLAVAVAVADVEGHPRADPLHQRVDRPDPPRDVLGEPRIVGLVDLDVGRPGPDQLAQLDVHHPGEVERERLLGLVVGVPDALDEGVRPGDRDLGPALGEPPEEAELLDQPERPGGQPPAHHAVVEVVVEALARSGPPRRRAGAS